MSVRFGERKGFILISTRFTQGARFCNGIVGDVTHRLGSCANNRYAARTAAGSWPILGFSWMQPRWRGFSGTWEVHRHEPDGLRTTAAVAPRPAEDSVMSAVLPVMAGRVPPRCPSCARALPESSRHVFGLVCPVGTVFTASAPLPVVTGAGLPCLQAALLRRDAGPLPRSLAACPTRRAARLRRPGALWRTSPGWPRSRRTARGRKR